MRRSIVVILLCCISVLTIAQEDIKALRSGHVKMSVYFGDTLLNIVNNQVSVVTNFETNEIYININHQAFLSGIDSLDRYIMKNLFEPIKYNGLMHLEFYSLEKNRVEKFTMLGDLIIGNTTLYQEANGVLVSEKSGYNTDGRIYIHFDLKVSEFNLPEELLPLGENICVEISQPFTIN